MLSSYILATAAGGFLGLSLSSPLPSPSSSPPSGTSSSSSLLLQNRDFNSLLSTILDFLPDVDSVINDAVSIITDISDLIADVTDTSTTENGLGGGGGAMRCTDYTVIFARGTAEPGNVGVLAGPPFFQALGDIVGSEAVTLQGVNNYAASVEGFLEGGDSDGTANMVSLIEQALLDCPSSKLIVSGYSQGAQLVHNAVALLSTASAEAISAVVMFGDPDDGEAIANVDSSKVLAICHADDDICLHGDLVLLPHLTYAENAVQAAQFVAATA